MQLKQKLTNSAESEPDLRKSSGVTLIASSDWSHSSEYKKIMSLKKSKNSKRTLAFFDHKPCTLYILRICDKKWNRTVNLLLKKIFKV